MRSYASQAVMTGIQLPIGRWWVALAVFDALVLIGTSLYAGRAFDPFFDGLVMLLVGGLLWGLFTIVTGLAALRSTLARKYFLMLNLGAVLILLVAYSYHLYQRGVFRVGFSQAKTYMAVADLALNNYQHSHGHYPDSLQELDLSLQPPSGMVYIRQFDRHRPLDESYSVTFADAVYCRNDTWFIDD